MKILMMQALWTQDEAAYRGEMLELEPSLAWPKPTQQPYPPIIMGSGAGPKTFAHIVEFCDGWMPIYGRRPIADETATLRATAAAAGRDPDTLTIGLFNAPRDRDQLAELARVGVDRAIFGLPAAAPATVLEKLAEYAALKDQI